MSFNAVVIAFCLPLLGYWLWYALGVIGRIEPSEPKSPPRAWMLLLS